MHVVMQIMRHHQRPAATLRPGRPTALALPGGGRFPQSGRRARPVPLVVAGAGHQRRPTLCHARPGAEFTGEGLRVTGQGRARGVGDGEAGDRLVHPGGQHETDQPAFAQLRGDGPRQPPRAQETRLEGGPPEWTETAGPGSRAARAATTTVMPSWAGSSRDQGGLTSWGSTAGRWPHRDRSGLSPQWLGEDHAECPDSSVAADHEPGESRRAGIGDADGVGDVHFPDGDRAAGHDVA